MPLPFASAFPRAFGVLAVLLFGSAVAEGADPAPKSAQTGPAVLARQLVGAFDALFHGPHPATRTIHAKGILLEGTFNPSKDAAGLSHADHFTSGPIPLLVRFSTFAGIPTQADGGAGASPRGMAIKFLLPDGGDTDIVAHSYNGFPAGTPEDFLAFLLAAGAPDPETLEDFTKTHPAAAAFDAATKPAPRSFASEAYFGVNAFQFTNAAGISRYGRYRIIPVDGTAYLSPADAKTQCADYLAEDMHRLLVRRPVRFRLMVQLADPGDDIADGSIAWPADRPEIDAGTITVTGFLPADDARQQSLLFTPLNLVGGIAPSADPMLVARNRAYRISYRRRNEPPAAPQREAKAEDKGAGFARPHEN